MLDGRVARKLSESLMDAFHPQRLDEMLFYRLSKDRARITMAGNYESIVYEVIRAADAEGWLDRLIVAARQSRPSHAGLRDLAEGRHLTTAAADGLEAILSRRMPEIHPAEWRARLGVLEGQVGRVEAGGEPRGTGFLVGMDLFLTSWHVVRDTEPAAIRLRLDYRREGGGILAGTTAGLAADWLVGSSPVEELDFALLRLATEVGAEPLGAAGEPGAAARGFVGSTGTARAGDHIVVLQHPLGGPVQMRFGVVEELVGGRLRHTADTQPGSSGSPCFLLDWTLVGLHQGADPGVNKAVPIGPILG